MQHNTQKIVGVMMSVLMGSMSLAQYASAADITAPKDVIGITEVTYETLKNVTCDYHSNARCGTLVDQLAGSVVMRVKHAGELYFVSQPYDLPILKRWLPNGLYRTEEGKFILVKDALKIPLPANKIAKRTQALVKNDAVIGVAESDFAALMTTCEGSDVACIARYQRGQSLFQHLAGSIIMRVEHAGELYYVNPNEEPSPSAVRPWLDETQTALSSSVSTTAIVTPSSLIAEMTTGKGVYFKKQ